MVKLCTMYNIYVYFEHDNYINNNIILLKKIIITEGF